MIKFVISDCWDEVLDWRKNNTAEIELYGSWNNWQSSAEQDLDHNHLCFVLDIQPGTYQFKLKCGDEWYLMLTYPTTRDKDGNTNNVIHVDGSRTYY